MHKRNILTQLTCAAAVTAMVACHSDGSAQTTQSAAPAATTQQAASTPVARDVVEVAATTTAPRTATASQTAAAAPAAAATAAAPASPSSKPGFVTILDERDGRIWVLREGEKPSNRMVAIPGVGPAGKTLKSLDRETIIEYLAIKPGFVTFLDEKDGRLWVLLEGEKPSNRHVAVPGQGPLGTTLKSLDRSTINAFLAAR